MRSSILCSLLPALAVAVSGMFVGPAVGAPPSLPTKPFSGNLELVANQTRVIGPGNAGTLGVTSFIITNADSKDQTLFIFAPVIGGASCNAPVNGGGGPSFSVFVPPRQTVQFTFPTPLVFTKINGVSCMAAEVTTQQAASVSIAVNGFIQ